MPPLVPPVLRPYLLDAQGALPDVVPWALRRMFLAIPSPLAVFYSAAAGDTLDIGWRGPKGEETRAVLVTSRDERHVYTSSGKVRPGHFAGGVLTLYPGTKPGEPPELVYQATMQQQAGRVRTLTTRTPVPGPEGGTVDMTALDEARKQRVYDLLAQNHGWTRTRTGAELSLAGVVPPRERGELNPTGVVIVHAQHTGPFLLVESAQGMEGTRTLAQVLWSASGGEASLAATAADLDAQTRKALPRASQGTPPRAPSGPVHGDWILRLVGKEIRIFYVSSPKGTSGFQVASVDRGFSSRLLQVIGSGKDPTVKGLRDPQAEHDIVEAPDFTPARVYGGSKTPEAADTLVRAYLPKVGIPITESARVFVALTDGSYRLSPRVPSAVLPPPRGATPAPQTPVPRAPPERAPDPQRVLEDRLVAYLEQDARSGAQVDNPTNARDTVLRALQDTLLRAPMALSGEEMAVLYAPGSPLIQSAAARFYDERRARAPQVIPPPPVEKPLEEKDLAYFLFLIDANDGDIEPLPHADPEGTWIRGALASGYLRADKTRTEARPRWILTPEGREWLVSKWETTRWPHEFAYKYAMDARKFTQDPAFPPADTRLGRMTTLHKAAMAVVNGALRPGDGRMVLDTMAATQGLSGLGPGALPVDLGYPDPTAVAGAAYQTAVREVPALKDWEVRRQGHPEFYPVSVVFLPPSSETPSRLAAVVQQLYQAGLEPSASNPRIWEAMLYYPPESPEVPTGVRVFLDSHTAREHWEGATREATPYPEEASGAPGASEGPSSGAGGPPGQGVIFPEGAPLRDVFAVGLGVVQEVLRELLNQTDRSQLSPREAQDLENFGVQRYGAPILTGWLARTQTRKWHVTGLTGMWQTWIRQFHPDIRVHPLEIPALTETANKDLEALAQFEVSRVSRVPVRLTITREHKEVTATVAWVAPELDTPLRSSSFGPSQPKALLSLLGGDHLAREAWDAWIQSAAGPKLAGLLQILDRWYGPPT